MGPVFMLSYFNRIIVFKDIAFFKKIFTPSRCRKICPKGDKNGAGWIHTFTWGLSCRGVSTCNTWKYRTLSRVITTPEGQSDLYPGQYYRQRKTMIYHITLLLIVSRTLEQPCGNKRLSNNQCLYSWSTLMKLSLSKQL